MQPHLSKSQNMSINNLKTKTLIKKNLRSNASKSFKHKTTKIYKIIKCIPFRTHTKRFKKNNLSSIEGKKEQSSIAYI